MKLCKKCILPSTHRNIHFDDEGVCNYCRYYSLHQKELTDSKKLNKLLTDRFNKVRGKYNYDCLVGLSGGKDSSYVAYILKRKYKLKILAYTGDNGFLSKFAKKNVTTVVDKLGIDHFFNKINPDICKKLYEGSIRRFGVPCIACTDIGMIIPYKIAFEKNIPLYVGGRSKAQMFRELSEDSVDWLFNIHRENNLSSYSRDSNKEVLSQVIKITLSFLNKAVPDKRLRQKVIKACFPNNYTDSELIPERIQLFLYEKYDERMFMNVLEKEIGWEPPSSKDILTHYDCLAHDAAAYLYNKIWGYSLLAQELSYMIRAGEVTREEALRRLEKEKLNTYPYESMKFMCKKTGVREEEIPYIIRRQVIRKKILKFPIINQLWNYYFRNFIM